MTDLDRIRTCVAKCASARDDRGRWRPATRLAIDLEESGTSPLVATETALAAWRFGAWLQAQTGGRK